MGCLLFSASARAEDRVVLSTEGSEWRAMVIQRETPRQGIGAPAPDWARPPVRLSDGWHGADFNDRDWARFSLPLPNGVDAWGRGGRHIGHIAARGLFTLEGSASGGTHDLGCGLSGRRGGVPEWR